MLAGYNSSCGSVMSHVYAYSELCFRRQIVEQLRKGLTVDPELFESVTIMFSGIVGFMEFVGKSTPLMVTNFLNSMYSAVDPMLEEFDVYKVETISDSYMVRQQLRRCGTKKRSKNIAQIRKNQSKIFCSKFVDPSWLFGNEREPAVPKTSEYLNALGSASGQKMLSDQSFFILTRLEPKVWLQIFKIFEKIANQLPWVFSHYRYLQCLSFYTWAYVFQVASGLPVRGNLHHAREICSLALIMMQRSEEGLSPYGLKLKIGVHSGKDRDSIHRTNT